MSIVNERVQNSDGVSEFNALWENKIADDVPDTNIGNIAVYDV